MAELWDDLLNCLDLSGDARGGDAAVFEGKNLRLDYHRLFGGQLLAQFTRAAALTCPDKAVKSIHVLFPREGTADEPVRYDVTRHHEGRTFGSLAVVASQPSRGVIGTASVSMHAPEEGRAVQTVPPVDGDPADSAPVEVGLLPFETRTSDDLDSPDEAAPEYSLWWKTPALPFESLAPAVAAYATDLTLIGTALRAVPGMSQRDAQQKFTSAVTSHTVWFHRPFSTSDDWLLLRQHSPLMAGGRSFGRGDILTSDGTLVASYAQEAMVRFRDTD